MKKTLTIIILLILLLLSTIGLVMALSKETAVIEQKETTQDNFDGTVRISVNSCVIIKNKTMQNLNFVNHNENRLLKFRIVQNDEVLYRSSYVEPGNEIVGDFIDVDTLTEGLSEAIVEVEYYTLDKERIGQTNVKVELNYLK